MPSNITPKDFERFLPEERDTIAQGILKYIQFAILFWRWYRDAYNSDGTLSYAFKEATCRTGCLGSKGVVEGVPEGGAGGSDNEDGTGEPSDDSRDQNNPEPGLPVDDPPAPGPDTPGGGADGCCPATKKGYDSFYFWERVKNVDLKCNNFTKSVAAKTGAVRGVNFDTGSDLSSSFQNLLGWGSWGGATYVPVNTGEFGVNEQGGYGQIVGEQGKNTWAKLSIFIYGKTPELYSIGADEDDENKKRKPDIRGRVSYNDDKQEVDFKIKNGANFGAEVNIIHFGYTRGKFDEALRQIKIHICPYHTLEIGDTNPTREDYWPLSVKNGRRVAEQPYMTHVFGIRIVLLASSFTGKSDPTKQLQVGVDANEHQVILDERWQNEIPCYMPTKIPDMLPAFGPPEARATCFTTDGMSEGYGEIYPVSVPNEWDFTDVVGRF